MSSASSGRIVAKAIATFGVLAGLFGLIATAPDQASAAELVISPKNEKTITRTDEGKLTPRKLRYRLSVKGGRKVKWQLRSVPRWLKAEPRKGTAVARRRTVVLTPNAARIAKLKPGYYSSQIRFIYVDKKKRKAVKRNVTLLVEGDADIGEDIFLARCSGCHSLFQNMSGPFLRNVYGRKAGTAGGFNHSDALRAYGKVWQERNLNDWLTNPQKLVRKAKMYVRVKKPADRMNLIAYLKSVSQ